MIRKLEGAVVAVLALTLTVFTLSPTFASASNKVLSAPLSLRANLAAVPDGWVPVAYGDAQVSVPATWDVLTNAWCGRTLPPIIQLGKVSQSISCPTAPPPPTVQNNSARFRSSPLPKWPPGHAGRYIRAPWTQECRINLLLRAVAEC